MRTYVSKMLVGTALANTSGAPQDPLTLTDGQVIAMDFDTRGPLAAGSLNIGFARGTSVLGSPIIAGPITKKSIETSYSNPYEAPVNQVSTLQVNTLPAADKDGYTVTFKVIYHDNLSIVPNQIKQSLVSVVFVAGDTASTFATKIKEEFEKQAGSNLFVVPTVATDTVTFTGITLQTQSKYNGIDRPEALFFEVGAPQAGDGLGTYTITETTAGKTGQGDASKVAWMEDQHMGRQGYSDRRMWNNTTKYPSQVNPAETYDVVVVQGNEFVEGDMQGLRANPVGAIVACDGADASLIVTDLATAGVTVTAVPAS